MNQHDDIDQFLSLYAGELSGYAAALDVQLDDIADILQEVWVEYYRHHETIEDPRAWLRTVLYRKCINHLKKERRASDYRESVEPPPVTPLDVEVENEEISRGLEDFIERELTPLEGRILWLRYEENLSWIKIAKTVGLPHWWNARNIYNRDILPNLRKFWAEYDLRVDVRYEI